MKMKNVLSVVLAAVLLLGTAGSTAASGVHYLPDVTKEMSSPLYWTDEQEVLMTYDEIEELNRHTITEEGTYMYELENMAETVDGIALNEAIKKSSEADAAYYLGWTYLGSAELATEEDYSELIENTRNPDAEKKQKVLYGIAVKRTELRTFPSYTPIWDDLNDTDFDYQYLASIRVNEPVVITSVSKDGRFYLAKSICCSGWIPADDVAICKDKAEWMQAWDIEPEEAFVVWGDKVFTEVSVTGAETSELMLTMGTVLKLADNIDPNELTDNRAAYNNYAVWIPVRNEDGSFSEKLTLISEHKKVNAGYLPLTKENVSKVVFSALGNTYGWGGSLYSDDCSGYMRNVYKCFGIELARNTTWQSSMPMAKVDMQYMCREERLKVMDALPFGAILYFNGHEMMYLGKENDKYFVISAVGTVVIPGETPLKQRIRGTVINSLDVLRANGNTWLDELTLALVPYYDSDDNNLPEPEWYHDGVSYCLKNKIMQGDTDKFFNPDSNVTWAELLQILFNMEEDKEADKTENAEDENTESEWYDGAVSWAEENNIIHESDADFEPEGAVTREELASVLYLYAQYRELDTDVGEDTNILSYDDAEDISDYAVPAVQFAVGSALISGKTEKTINPKDNTTRAEIAVILMRMMKKTIDLQ